MGVEEGAKQQINMALLPLPSSSPLSSPTTSHITKSNMSLSFLPTSLALSPNNHLLLSPASKTITPTKEEVALSSTPPPLVGLDGGVDLSLIDRSILRDHKCLKELSTWGIGGPCKYFIQVSRPSELVSAIRYCEMKRIQYLIVGRGSNCLFDDRGFDGLVILNRLDQFEVIEPGVYMVGSGYPFNRLGVRCSVEGYSGLEFAGGIPGTVGGAVFMNAGANEQDTGSVIDEVEIVTTEGEVQRLRRSDIAFGYRWSSFQEMTDLAAILSARFRLTAAEKSRERQRALLERRRRTQPIRERTAGSVFRNPLNLGISAGELIELAGLKGFEIGGAKVSPLHANFFINFNSSTSSDMLLLINHVKEEVHRVFQVQLKEEMRYVPYRN
ncbi:uncharacterized protein LOC109709973 [Ananas comosus]|uniref:UDP-N-acetylmuramate dehydrogenase n=1 Tax=Ananas comosus TaxID=4615 RepID=A0A6P5EWK4_ANACO|nr:uncharacterized protein LOC109709973 [Ananas comosus]